ncbi:MAG: HEAT repeat domain-containing protein [Woeseiaceae bacterium]|nr:HEAT repeat domain-containing protein [Woeseiaceae bacterium]
MKTTTRRPRFGFPLGAGLLILGSLALPFASQAGADPLVRVDDGLVTLRADELPRAAVVTSLARAANLRLVSHTELGGTLTATFSAAPLGQVLSIILEDDSYQLLYRSSTSSPDREAAGTLWIFATGRDGAARRPVGPESQLLHGDLAAKKAAIRTLRDSGDAAAVHALSLALADPDGRIRDTALDALARIGSDAALAAIASLAGVDDYWTRVQAADALSRTDSRSAVGHLAIALDDPDPRVRMAVLEALADIPRADSIAVIRRARLDPDPEVRSFVGEALDDAHAAIALAAGRETFSPAVPGESR